MWSGLRRADVRVCRIDRYAIEDRSPFSCRLIAQPGRPELTKYGALKNRESSGYTYSVRHFSTDELQRRRQFSHPLGSKSLVRNLKLTTRGHYIFGITGEWPRPLSGLHPANTDRSLVDPSASQIEHTFKDMNDPSFRTRFSSPLCSVGRNSLAGHQRKGEFKPKKGFQFVGLSAQYCLRISCRFHEHRVTIILLKHCALVQSHVMLVIVEPDMKDAVSGTGRKQDAPIKPMPCRNTPLSYDLRRHYTD